MVLHTEESTFEQFREAWVEEIDAMESSVDKGREFAIRLASQWLDVDQNSDEFHYTDGPGDGGIDVAYLHHGAHEFDDEQSNELLGDTWFVFQCKYGTAGEVGGVARDELRKMFETLTGNEQLSKPAGTTVNKIRNFLRQEDASNDRVVLVIGTVDPLKQRELVDVETARREFASRSGESGPSIDIEAVSLKTVHDAVQERSTQEIEVDLNGVFTSLSEGSWVGKISIKAMYDMLLQYREASGELDQIYDKNVRRWLGIRKGGGVNARIAETIKKRPEDLGIYNNGVTFVCSDFKRRERGKRGWMIVDPYIVNGCQTTRTLFDVVDEELGSGGTGKSSKPGRSYGDCHFVAKVVKTQDHKRLTAITRYTNTQNAVRDSDLVAVDVDYNRWKEELEAKHRMYLEIQRGGWESRRAFEKARPGLLPRLTGRGAVPVKANDIIKVFGAGWLGSAGTAARRLRDFIPGPDTDGSVFGEIRKLTKEDRFGADDFKAGQAVFLAGKELRFGARGAGIERAMTRYMFYYVFIELIRAIGSRGRTPSSLPTEEVTRLVLVLEQHPDEFANLADIAAQTVSDYTVGLTDTPPYTLDKAFTDTRNWEGVVKSHRMDAENIAREVPRFRQAIDNKIAAMRMSMGSAPPIFFQYQELLGVGRE